MWWLVPILGLGSGAAAALYLLRPKDEATARRTADLPPPSAPSAPAAAPKADECAVLLERVTQQARRITTLPSAVVDPLYHWIAHANGANVRALSATGRARLPARWRVVKTIAGRCMGDPVDAQAWRPDDTGRALPDGAWVTIGAVLSGEGPPIAITGMLGPSALRQLQADDRWLVLSGAPPISVPVPVPATPPPQPPKPATPARPAAPPARASSSPSTAAKSLSSHPGALPPNLKEQPALLQAEDHSTGIMKIAQAVMKSASAMPLPQPAKPAGALSSSTTSAVSKAVEKAIQDNDAVKARARGAAALAQVQKKGA